MKRTLLCSPWVPSRCPPLGRQWGLAALILRGGKLIEKREDTHQLGGNFIVASRSVVPFVYPSRDPTDRPSVEEMMTVLKRL